MREEILAADRLTPGKLDAGPAQLREHLSEPGTLTCLPTIWQVWGSKPPQAAAGPASRTGT